MQASVTVFPERPMAQYSGMPWWIILVAILLGLLLLALLIFLLWKVRDSKQRWLSLLSGVRVAELHCYTFLKEMFLC